MSLMRCALCENVIDTDDDPDGFYVIGHEHEFICQWCRDDRKLETVFDRPSGARYVE